MPKNLKVAAVQMMAEPASVEERLRRAERLIAQAAQNGARLVVLPELFNTGYQYSDQNYQLAEPLDGQTATWMRRLASQYGLHLAGAFLRREQGEIYDTLLLVAPDQRFWIYDKLYPWMWERAYFREGKGTTVADTDLGKIGLLICWDAAHPYLWQRYAGQVELMLVSSCPPAVHDLTLLLPDGKQVRLDELGSLMRRMRGAAQETFGAHLRRQSGCLKVPVVNTTGTGLFNSRFPSPLVSLMTFALTCPRLWKYVPQADRVRVEARYFNETYVADAAGKVLQRVPAEKEGYALSEVALPPAPPEPQGQQPAFGISRLNYLLDAFANWALAPVYRRRIKLLCKALRDGEIFFEEAL